ncbi:MAG: hypothetical protein ACLP5E_24410, partial [Streptosporangiaceae bacterium]
RRPRRTGRRRIVAAARILRGGVVAGAERTERATGGTRGAGITAGLGSRSVPRHPLTSSLSPWAAWRR